MEKQKIVKATQKNITQHRKEWSTDSHFYMDLDNVMLSEFEDGSDGAFLKCTHLGSWGRGVANSRSAWGFVARL
jgi:hypothetical protein